MLVPPDLIPTEFRERVVKELTEARRRVDEYLSTEGGEMPDISHVIPRVGQVVCPVEGCKFTTMSGLQGLSVHLGSKHKDLSVAQRRAYCGLPAKSPSDTKPKANGAVEEPLPDRIARLSRALEEGASKSVEDMIRDQVTKIEEARKAFEAEVEKLKGLVAHAY